MAAYSSYLFLLFMLICCIGLIAFIVYKILYKNRVCIREVTENKKIIRTYPCREYIDKEGALYWRLWGEKIKERKNLPVPPADVIDTMPNGKKFAECYRFPTGEIAWIKDSNTVKTIPKELLNLNIDNISPELLEYIRANVPEDIININDLKEKEIKELAWIKNEIEKIKENDINIWKEENKIIEAYQPVTTNQRQILINNYRKAAERKTTSTVDKMIQYIPMGALVLIIILGLVFFKDLSQPFLDKHTQELQYQTTQKESLELIKDIKQDIQRIEGMPVTINKNVNNSFQTIK